MSGYSVEAKLASAIKYGPVYVTHGTAWEIAKHLARQGVTIPLAWGVCERDDCDRPTVSRKLCDQHKKPDMYRIEVRNAWGLPVMQRVQLEEPGELKIAVTRVPQD